MHRDPGVLRGRITWTVTRAMASTITTGRTVRRPSSGETLFSYGRFAPEPSLTERTEPSWHAVINLSVQASAVALVGPDELAEVAKEIRQQALIVDWANIVGSANAQICRGDDRQPSTTSGNCRKGRRTGGGRSREEGDRAVSEQFEAKAAELLRPAGQKNGRKWGPRWLPWN